MDRASTAVSDSLRAVRSAAASMGKGIVGAFSHITAAVGKAVGSPGLLPQSERQVGGHIGPVCCRLPCTMFSQDPWADCWPALQRGYGRHVGPCGAIPPLSHFLLFSGAETPLVKHMAGGEGIAFCVSHDRAIVDGWVGAGPGEGTGNWGSGWAGAVGHGAAGRLGGVGG